MTNRDELHALLCAYLLDEAGEEERARVEAELAASPELRSERDRIAATIGLVRNNAPRPEALSSDSHAKLLAAARGVPNDRGDAPARPAGRLLAFPIPKSGALRMAAAVLITVGGAAALYRMASVARFAPFAPVEGTSLETAANDVASPSRGSELSKSGAARNESDGSEVLRGLGYFGEDLPKGLATLGYAEAEGAKETRVTNRLRAAAGDREAAEPQSETAAFEKLEAYRFDTAAMEEAEEVFEEPALVDGGTVGTVGTYRGAGDTVPPAERMLDAVTAGERVRALSTSGQEAAGVDFESSEFFLGRGVRSGESEAKAGADVLVLRDDGQPLHFREPASPPAAAITPSARAQPLAGPVPATGGPGSPGGPSSPGPSATAGPASPGVGGPQPGAGANEPARVDDLESFGKLLDAYEQPDDRAYERRAKEEVVQHLRRARVPVAPNAGADEIVETLVRSCRRLPEESPSAMFFRFWGDNPFETTAFDNLSTFSIDVDTASYTLARRYLREGHLPTKEQIRTEEFINYFRPDVAPPVEDTFALDLELAPSRFGGADAERWMLRAVVRGKEVPASEREPLALTFVIDTSGSMKQQNRLELVKHALRLLVGQLDARDSLSIVAFSNEARLVLPMTSAGRRSVIENALYGVHPDGGTNAEAGIRLGYSVAAQEAVDGVNNRVVFLSDGVANIGQTDQDRITESVTSFRSKGIYLNAIGVGLGNHNDVFLEQLADKGDGLCNYVDGPEEAERALVTNFTQAFVPIARDVKIQVELDPSVVARYRLLGYENRAIADADFRNDAVDAGEVNAGHQVEALYELELQPGADPERALATMRVRYKGPHGGVEAAEVSEIERSIAFREANGTFGGTSAGYRRAAVVAQLAELLRRSVHTRGESFDDMVVEAAKLAPELRDPDFDELVELARAARELARSQWVETGELVETIDAMRRNSYLRAVLEELQGEEDAAVRAEIEAQNRELEARIRALLQERLDSREH